MSALSDRKPDWTPFDRYFAKSDDKLANMAAELDAYRAEVERLQIALNQIERSATAGQTVKGNLASVTSHAVATLDNIARIAQANSNRQPPFAGRKTPATEFAAQAAAEVAYTMNGQTYDQIKEAMERHQKAEGEALQDRDCMIASLNQIREESRVALYPDCQCLSGRCRECYSALGRIMDIAEAAPLKNGIPF